MPPPLLWAPSSHLGALLPRPHPEARFSRSQTQSRALWGWPGVKRPGRDPGRGRGEKSRDGGEAWGGSILPQRLQVSKAAGIKSRSRKKLAK